MAEPIFSLAPMQAISTLAFWRVMEKRGGPDVYITEYFRVHVHSTPERKILASLNESDFAKPILAQMIGTEPEYLVRTAQQIQQMTDCAGIDINLGCPSPRVCGRAAGGALLKSADLIREIVESLRPVVAGTLTLKTRVGFESEAEFESLLDLFSGLPIDGLAIHGRTVREKYQSEVHTREIAMAVEQLDIPVHANGSIVTVPTARSMYQKTRAAGLMIGRGAIRNPWLFDQIRQSFHNEEIYHPTLADHLRYVEDLYEEIASTSWQYEEVKHVQRMKKFMNYIASGIGGGEFSAEIRRVQSANQFWEVCHRHLGGSEPLPEEPTADGKLFCGFKELQDQTGYGPELNRVQCPT
ncbi:MAG: tRNA-dihydrouridine synthase family protein [Verrucomicrobiales bacterium]|nr:tRNA-dihydrouridine synthase family protein [Verrucomicrobiales bacterium]